MVRLMEGFHERFGMSSKGEVVKCGVDEWVKHSTLRWFSHSQRMDENVMTKRIHRSTVKDVGIRGRPPVRCYAPYY